MYLFYDNMQRNCLYIKVLFTQFPTFEKVKPTQYPDLVSYFIHFIFSSSAPMKKNFLTCWIIILRIITIKKLYRLLVLFKPIVLLIMKAGISSIYSFVHKESIHIKLETEFGKQNVWAFPHQSLSTPHLGVVPLSQGLLCIHKIIKIKWDLKSLSLPNVIEQETQTHISFPSPFWDQLEHDAHLKHTTK